MDKGLARLKTSNLLGRDAGVAASDPKVVGGLASTEADKEARVLRLLLLGPFAVVLEEAVVRLPKILLDVSRVGTGHDGRQRLAGFCRCRRRSRVVGTAAAGTGEACGGSEAIWDDGMARRR